MILRILVPVKLKLQGSVWRKNAIILGVLLEGKAGIGVNITFHETKLSDKIL